MTAAAPDDFDRDNDRPSVLFFLRSHGIVEADEDPAITMFPAGRSNLTYRFESSAGRFVLRRPPASNRLATAHNMRREFDIVRGLAGSKVAVPEAVALCEDPAVNGGIPFYVMSFVDGVVIDGTNVERVMTSKAERRAVSGAIIDELARIHNPANVARSPEITALDRGPGYLKRQVVRWGKQWTAATERRLADATALLSWLDDNVPDDAETALVHGDYRLDNCILTDGPAPAVAAVVDWEMGTVGDPFTDLAMFLLYWVRPGDPGDLLEMFPTANVSRHPGFPGREWVIGRYEQAVGRAWPNPTFYLALAFFKLAAICEGIHARYLAGGTRGDQFAGYGRRAETLLRYGRQLAGGRFSLM
jgi:aminoglycoside phosphotransferase (APT) family kinase protein